MNFQLEPRTGGKRRIGIGGSAGGKEGVGMPQKHRSKSFSVQLHLRPPQGQKLSMSQPSSKAVAAPGTRKAFATVHLNLALAVTFRENYAVGRACQAYFSEERVTRVECYCVLFIDVFVESAYSLTFAVAVVRYHRLIGIVRR